LHFLLNLEISRFHFCCFQNFWAASWTLLNFKNFRLIKQKGWHEIKKFIPQLPNVNLFYLSLSLAFLLLALPIYWIIYIGNVILAKTSATATEYVLALATLCGMTRNRNNPICVAPLKVAKARIMVSIACRCC
jgi:hypothetical protein